MKDYEDEAFEDIERAQGWRKRQIAEKQEQGEPVAVVATTNEHQAIITWRGTPLPHGSVFYTTPQQRKPLTDEQREKLRDAFAQSLTSVYVCGRVWEAWQYGTMSEGDFQPAGECEDVLDALIEAAHGIKE